MGRSRKDDVVEFRPRGAPRRALTVERFECRFVWTDGERAVGIDIELEERDGRKGYRSRTRASEGPGRVSRRDGLLACAARLEELARLIRENHGSVGGRDPSA